MTKRIFDFIFSLIGLILLLPILSVVALVIKNDSSGPVFYRAQRVGKGGKIFTMYKFRTMVVNADKIGGPSTPIDDPRLTKIGKMLKKFQLDELPQLINVLKGEMSLVGPRPEVPFYVAMMTEEEKQIILSVRPGMTDWASLWNFHEGDVLKGSPDPEKTYQEKIRPEKIRLQIKYARERTFLKDIGIIIKTGMRILK
jgi:lipopolysaccharide/colanic/teichoic acid biosynthesis glycosyltransferase